MDELNLSDEDQIRLKNLFDDFDSGELNYDLFLKHPFLSSLSTNFLEKMRQIKNRGKTAKLWIQYIEMVGIAKSFMR